MKIKHISRQQFPHSRLYLGPYRPWYLHTSPPEDRSLAGRILCFRGDSGACCHWEWDCMCVRPSFVSWCPIIPIKGKLGVRIKEEGAGRGGWRGEEKWGNTYGFTDSLDVGSRSLVKIDKPRTSFFCDGEGFSSFDWQALIYQPRRMEERTTSQRRDDNLFSLACCLPKWISSMLCLFNSIGATCKPNHRIYNPIKLLTGTPPAPLTSATNCFKFALNACSYNGFFWSLCPNWIVTNTSYFPLYWAIWFKTCVQ